MSLLPPNVPSNTWNNRIARLIERDGCKCHYCTRPLHIRRELADARFDDATIDHKIPRSQGGTNEMDNLVLACRKCNHEKEDRSYADFKARPYRVKPWERRILYPASPWPRAIRENPAVRAVLAAFPGAEIVGVRKEKVYSGSLAAAINRGEVDEAGRYYKPSSVPIAYADPKAQAAYEAVYRDRLHMLRVENKPARRMDRARNGPVASGECRAEATEMAPGVSNPLA